MSAETRGSGSQEMFEHIDKSRYGVDPADEVVKHPTRGIFVTGVEFKQEVDNRKNLRYASGAFIPPSRFWGATIPLDWAEQKAKFKDADEDGNYTLICPDPEPGQSVNQSEADTVEPPMPEKEDIFDPFFESRHVPTEARLGAEALSRRVDLSTAA